MLHHRSNERTDLSGYAQSELDKIALRLNQRGQLPSGRQAGNDGAFGFYWDNFRKTLNLHFQVEPTD
jgi:hypothetical protein